MRKDNAIFFLAGLAFGALLGYFVSKSVSAPSAGAPAAAAPMTSAAPEPPRRVLDPGEMAALEKRAQESPADIDVRIQMGTLYLEAGRYTDALRVLDEARGKAPDNLHLRTHLALALENLKRYDEASAEYEALLAKDSSYPEALLGLGRIKLYQKRDIRGGIELWEKLLKAAPDSAAARSIRDELEALKTAHPVG